MKRRFLLAMLCVFFVLSLSANLSFAAESKKGEQTFASDGQVLLFIDENGQVWQNKPALSSTPEKILDNAKSVYIKNSNYFIVTQDNTLWGWGMMYPVFEGVPFITDRPHKLMDNVKSVASSVLFRMVLQTDDTLWSWGSNTHGQLGNGNHTDSSVPVKIMDGVKSVDVGFTHAVALKQDGTLWAWGNNADAQLGDGTTTSRNTPVKIMDDVMDFSVGFAENMAIKNDGSLWAWGVENPEEDEYKRTYINEPVKIYSKIVLPENAIVPINLSSASEWAKDSIMSAMALKLVPEELQTAYTQNITREEFCRLAVNYLTVKTGKTMEEILMQKGLLVNTNVFSDTKDSDILAAHALGIVNGIGAGQFNPNGYISREEAATMLGRTQTALDIDITKAPPSGFADSAQFNVWSKVAINYVSSQAIMNGMGENRFDPQGRYTREQAIITFYRMFGVS